LTVVDMANGRLKGLSSDTKPTTYAVDTIFFETDTRKTYYWNGLVWTEQAFTGSSGGPPSIVYDPFYYTYTISTDDTLTSNSLWRVVYRGQTPETSDNAGRVGVRAPAGGAFTRVLYEYPYPNSYAGANTSASLVVTNGAYFTDFDMSLSMRTVAQKRTSPATWETAWIMFRYNTAGFAHSAAGSKFHHYYVTLKSNSTIELGKKDNVASVDEQYFISTSATYSYSAGTWYKVRIRAIGNQITVWVDDIQKINLTDDGSGGAQGGAPNTPAAPSTYLYSGVIGLYNEDAEVEFSPMSIVPIGARVY
jgi:hypothetical protein